MQPSFHPPETIPEAAARFYELHDQMLAPYAMCTRQSRGRRHLEPPHAYRTEYVRDRDRIVHSTAFRRLMSKTQVFVGQPNDHQRTRLTHTLEVSQIARTVARNLCLNEDLTEAVALAHDLGHPPFGHAGERALADLMADSGGFEHNRQGLRLVEFLEQRYPAFDGLNLTYEVLQSIALHSHQRDHPAIAEFQPLRRMLAESQVVDLADSIAYDTHDLDDALRTGLIELDDLRRIELWRLAEDRARGRYGPQLAGGQLARAVIRALIDWQVSSLLAESERRLAPLASPADVQNAAHNAVAMEVELARLKHELEAFLRERVYRHEQVIRTTRNAENVVRQLFEKLAGDASLLPARYQARLEVDPMDRVVSDFIAGMTDRFAQRLHRDLLDRST